MTNIPNPSQLRTQARPAPDCLPGRHCERHARGLGGCIAGECNRPAPAEFGHPLPPAKVQAYADNNGVPPDGVDGMGGIGQQARDAYEREFQADSRDPSQARRFDVYLRGYIAAGVTPTSFHCAREGMCDATPRCTVQCAACADDAPAVAPTPVGPLQQMAAGIEALDEGHDPLCMAVLRGKACTCGVDASDGTKEKN